MPFALTTWLGRGRTRTAPKPARPWLAVEPLEDRLVPTGLPPAVLISGLPQVGEAAHGPYTLDLIAVDPENDPVTEWRIDWGDGSPVQTVPGNPSRVSHAFADGAGYLANVTASAVVGGETFAAQVATPGAYLGTFAAAGGGQDLLAFMTFGPDVTGAGGQPDGVEDLYVGGHESDDLALYDGATGAYVRTLITAADGISGTWAVVVGPDGNLYVSGRDSNAVLRYDVTTGTVSPFVAPGSVWAPTALAFGPDGNLYVAAAKYSIGVDVQIKVFDGSTGAYLKDFAYARMSIWEMEFRPDGYLYAAVEATGIVRYDAATGTQHDIFVHSGSKDLPDGGFGFGADGDLYVANHGSPVVNRFDGVTGALVGTFTGADPTSSGVDVAFGPDRNGDGRPELYVTDEGTNTVGTYAGPLTTSGATTLPVAVLDARPNTYASSPNAAIPSDQRTYSWTINVPNGGSVLDVNVTLGITHPVRSELQAWLVSPSGTRVELSQAAIAGTAVGLQQFDGEPVQGAWTLQIRDGVKSNRGTLNSWSLTITRGIGPAGEPPVAVNDTAQTTAGTAVTINALANDSDPEGGPLTVTAFTQPAAGKGTVSFDAATQRFVYVPPDASFTGTVTFTYTITDAAGNTSTATVTITVKKR